MSAATPQDLRQLWDAAQSSPFSPTVGKDYQFTIAFALLLAAFVLSGVFALSKASLPR